MEKTLVLTLSAIVGLGIACQWLAWRLRVPAILPLLVTGFLVGPVTGLLHPQELLGELFFPVISLSVAVILFEGSLTLEFREVRRLRRTVRRLVSLGALVTWVGGAVAARWLFGMGWALAFLFGALIVVTGPTVIGPLLRNVRPTSQVASVLKWESILIDPIGALLAVVMFDIMVAEGPFGDFRLQALMTFLRIVVVGSVVGVASGLLLREAIRRHLVPDYLRDLFVLAAVLVAFAISDAFQSESGLLSVTVMGILLANSHLKPLHELWHFKERISVLLISGLFILLAANIERQALGLINVRSLGLLAIVLFVLRPLSILVSTLGSTLTRNERLFLAWIAPRGIVAASVSSLFGVRLMNLGFEGAELLAPLTFLVIVGTVVAHGSTAKWLACRLGVAEAEPQGFLFMGANPFARALARSLQQEGGFRVLLVDTNYRNVSQARLDGLQAHHGNALDENVQEELDFGGLGRLMALTSNDEANVLACLEYRWLFGSQEVYQVAPVTSDGGLPFSRSSAGRLLFHPEATYHVLAEALRAGGAVKVTLLTEQFSFDDFCALWQERALPLLAFRQGQVMVATTDAPFRPEAGWHLVALVHETEPVLAITSDNRTPREAARRV